MNGFLVILPRTAASSGTFPGDDIVKTSPACGHGKLFTAVAWLDTRVAPDRARRRQTDVCTRQLRRYNWCRGARPAAARHVGWLAGRVCGGGHGPCHYCLVSTEARGPGDTCRCRRAAARCRAWPAGGSRRGAVQECRRGAGRQDRRQRRFCSVVLWLEMAAVAVHVVTPSQLTLDTGGDLAGSSTAPLHGMNGARPDTAAHWHQLVTTHKQQQTVR